VSFFTFVSILNSGLFFVTSVGFRTVLRTLKGGGLYLIQLHTPIFRDGNKEQTLNTKHQ
jgi:hypothetical protein